MDLVGGATRLTFSVHNPNPGMSLTAIGFTDTLPAGLVVATPNGLSGSCGGGTITADAGTQSISLSGASLDPDAMCTFSVGVTSTAEGVQQDITSTISSTEAGAGPAASSSIFVGLPPAMTKSFTPGKIALGFTSRLALTISNPNTSTQLSGIAFSDTLPAGLVVARPSNASDSCVHGTLAALPGARTIALTRGQLPAGATCQVTVTVKGTLRGIKRSSSGPVMSRLTVPGNRASAYLTFIGPPSVTLGSPKNGGHYALHQKVRARYSCQDDLYGPGIRSCTGTVPNGALVSTAKPGRHAFTVKARSQDGLTTSVTVHYTLSLPARGVAFREPMAWSAWLHVF